MVDRTYGRGHWTADQMVEELEREREDERELGNDGNADFAQAVIDYIKEAEAEAEDSMDMALAMEGVLIIAEEHGCTDSDELLPWLRRHIIPAGAVN